VALAVDARIGILRGQAEAEGVQLPDDVATYLAENAVTFDRRDLQGIMIRVVAYASLTALPITVALAKDVLMSIHSDADVRH
jgi:chromosomal replication initiator protein